MSIEVQKSRSIVRSMGMISPSTFQGFPVKDVASSQRIQQYVPGLHMLRCGKRDAPANVTELQLLWCFGKMAQNFVLHLMLLSLLPDVSTNRGQLKLNESKGYISYYIFSSMTI